MRGSVASLVVGLGLAFPMSGCDCPPSSAPSTLRDGAYVTSSMVQPPRLDSFGTTEDPPPQGEDRTAAKTLTIDTAKSSVIVEYDRGGKKIIERYRIEESGLDLD